MKICIDSDESGNALKTYLIGRIGVDKCRDLSFGGNNQYPDIALNLAMNIAGRLYDRGILICATGQGMSMMANKVKGIYACACYDSAQARKLAESLNGQVLCLGAETTNLPHAAEIVATYLATPFGSRPNAKRMRELEDF